MSLYGLISDIHADPVGLELAWAHLTVMGVDSIICAGDLVGYGSMPDQVVDFVEQHGIRSVRGNHDRWALERGLGVPDEFGGSIPSQKTLDFLRLLPPSLVFEHDDRTIAVVHGSPRGDMEFMTPERFPGTVLDEMLKSLGVDILIHGHTHRPMCYRSDIGLVINPGSVISAPVVETSRTFGLLDLQTLSATIHEVESGDQQEFDPWPVSR